MSLSDKFCAFEKSFSYTMKPSDLYKTVVINSFLKEEIHYNANRALLISLQ